MANTIMCRHVDSLGRVVIPKDIRMALRIKVNDYLEMSVVDNKILLTKKNFFDENIDMLRGVFNVYKKILNVELLITDMDNIIYSNGKVYSDISQNEFNSEIYNLIIKRKETTRNNTDFINNKNVSFFLKPILYNGDILGSIILIKKKNDISEVDKFSINTIYNLMVNYLDV